MIKVLHVLTDTNIGGAGTYVATYVKNCDKETFLPTVLIPRNSAVLNLLKGADCEIIEADIAPDKSLDIRSIPILRKIIKKGKFDLVHAHGSASARIAAKGICKCLFTKHTLSESGGAASRLIYRALGGYAVAVSEISASNLIELGFNKNRIYTVYNGVDDMGVANEQTKSESKKSFGISPSDFVIGCVARMHPVKMHRTILEAAKTVAEKHNNVVFLFVGDGELKAELIDYASALGISERCVFAGVRYDREQVYHAMDVYTIASSHETFGLSLVESWSAALPSVISDAKGLVEVSKAADAAVVCKTGEAEQFANAYIDLIENSDKRKKIALRSLMHYKNKFSAKIFAKNLESVYKNICEK